MQLKQHKAIKEYGYLMRGGEYSSLEYQSLPSSDWDWLFHENLIASKHKSTFLRPASQRGKQALQVSNYVGVIEFPSGLQLEILPKISETDTEEYSRFWLLKMLFSVENIKPISFSDADLQTFKQPLLEILIGRFLASVQHVINRGLVSEYIREQSVEPYLRGKLMVSAHAKLPAHKKTIFPIEYDEYSLDTPENRLIHWAVFVVYHWSKSSLHKAHARKILTLLEAVPKSNNPISDVSIWKNNRLNQHYQPVKPWIDLIVAGISPKSQIGNIRGISLLYPMEQLFEWYVFKTLKKQLKPGFSLQAQKTLNWLATHNNESWFRLLPDLLIMNGDRVVSILDSKWKRLDGSMDNRTDKYGLKQSDFYQMFAYANKGLIEGGTLYLIYPLNNKFKKPLPKFNIGNGYELHVIPFDLENDALIGDINVRFFADGISVPQN